VPLNATQVVAGRDIYVFQEPWIYSNAFPVNTILWGTDWGGAWVNAGYTRDGVRFRMQVQRTPVLVDQVVDPILRIATQRDLEMQTRLAQITALNLSNATGQGLVTSVAAQDDYDISGTITDQFTTTGFDIRNPGDLLPIRIVGWKGLAMSDVELAFNVTESAVIAMNIAILPDTGTTANPITPARVARFRDINQ
jgi:hypothetical protein